MHFPERGNVNGYPWLDRASTWKEGDDMVEVTLRCVRALGAHETVGLEKSAGSCLTRFRQALPVLASWMPVG